MQALRAQAAACEESSKFSRSLLRSALDDSASAKGGEELFELTTVVATPSWLAAAAAE